ncbi:hypothetical protein QCA50_002987 [Cerrena zonata]|uniref:Uncharacterized protein n=1 Tax=Cerrena zonata TaxID=2478898 RepID=A0AAW0GNI7_9APHY
MRTLALTASRRHILEVCAVGFALARRREVLIPGAMKRPALDFLLALPGNVSTQFGERETQTSLSLARLEVNHLDGLMFVPLVSPEGYLSRGPRKGRHWTPSLLGALLGKRNTNLRQTFDILRWVET